MPADIDTAALRELAEIATSTPDAAVQVRVLKPDTGIRPVVMCQIPPQALLSLLDQIDRQAEERKLVENRADSWKREAIEIQGYAVKDLKRAEAAEAQVAELQGLVNAAEQRGNDANMRAQAAEAQVAELEDRRTKWENNDGMGGAVVVAIRNLLYEHKVPVSAYIDDHVRNALFALTKAEARVAELEEALAENARAAIDRGMALAAAEARVAELLAEIRRWDRAFKEETK